METVGAYEAKTHLAALLDRVARGERIAIARHGVPVAIMQPVHAPKRMAVREAIAELRRFRDRHPLGDDTIRSLIEEGRR
jgi:prevent-host-death family protein